MQYEGPELSAECCAAVRLVLGLAKLSRLLTLFVVARKLTSYIPIPDPCPHTRRNTFVAVNRRVVRRCPWQIVTATDFTDFTALENLLIVRAAKSIGFIRVVTGAAGLRDSFRIIQDAASGMMQNESLKPAAPVAVWYDAKGAPQACSPRNVTTRMNATDFAALPIDKFLGTENDKSLVVDRVGQDEAFVKNLLKSSAGMTPDLIDASLMQFFLYVLKD